MKNNLTTDEIVAYLLEVYIDNGFRDIIEVDTPTSEFSAGYSESCGEFLVVKNNSTIYTYNIAFGTGVKGFKNGVSIKDNPYQNGISKDYEQWVNGWLFQKQLTSIKGK